MGILSPKEGETVKNPITIKMAVTGITLVPASTPSGPGQGHFDVIIDDNVPSVGQVVPRDDYHLHVDNGATEFTLPKPLAPGKHRIVILFADSNHLVMNPIFIFTINITVAGAAPPIYP